MPNSDYMPEAMGRAELIADDPFEVASFGTLTFVYTAGRFGLDDQGAIKIAWRNCSDMARPQFDRPDAPGYATAEASNGVALACTYDTKGGIRPFSRALTVTATSGYLSPTTTLLPCGSATPAPARPASACSRRSRRTPKCGSWRIRSTPESSPCWSQR